INRRLVKGKDLASLGILVNKDERGKIFEKLERERTVQFEHTVPASGTGAPQVLEFVCNSYPENGLTLIQCNIRDIGQRKESERQLREALQELALAKEELEARVQERTADLQQRNAELEAVGEGLQLGVSTATKRRAGGLLLQPVARFAGAHPGDCQFHSAGLGGI